MTKISTAIGKSQQVPVTIWYFMAVFFVVNFLQAYFTPVIDDESYYSFYSEDLDWGYYDHPPMVAICIAFGHFFLGGVLGLRLLTTILFSSNILLFWKIVNHQKEIPEKSFVWVLISFVYLQIYGFITTPDVPFIFFSLLFLRQYQCYLKTPSITNGLLWGVIMALLMYSKYLGVLLVGFTLLSNIKLLQKLSFWLAGILGILLFFPHLYWQWEQDFPSLYYHLFYRKEASFQLGFLLNSLINVPLVILPLGWVGCWFLVKDKTADLFIRALKYNAIGTIIFFAYFSTTNIVQPQWLTTYTLSVMIYSILHFSETGRLSRWTKRVVVLVVGGALIIRLLLGAVDIVSKQFFLNIRNMDWTYGIAEKVGNNPVLFINNFQQPSLYRFYTQKPVFCFNSIMYRQTQFDVWNLEAAAYQKTVYLVRTDSFRGAERWDIDRYGTYYGRAIDNYMPFQKMRIKTKSVHFSERHVDVVIELENTYPFDFERNEQLDVSFFLMLKDKTGRVQKGVAIRQKLDFLAAKSTKEIALKFFLGKSFNVEDYKELGVSLRSPLLGVGFNGDFVAIP